MVEAVAHGVFHQPRGFRAGEFFLGLALELRLPEEGREFRHHLAQQIVGGDIGGALVGAMLAPARRPLTSAARKPASCVPPCGVGRCCSNECRKPSPDSSQVDCPFQVCRRSRH